MKELAKIVLTCMGVLLTIGSGIAGTINGIIMLLHILNGDEIL